MSYTPTEWEPGDTLTASGLNNLESGIADANGSYTPTVWTDGSKVTAALLNHMEQGIAAGGGLPAGLTNLAYGTFTMASDQDDRITVTHNLGVIPKYAVLYDRDYSPEARETGNLTNAYLNGFCWNATQAESYYWSSVALVTGNTGQISSITGASGVVVPLGRYQAFSNTTMKLEYNSTYYLHAGHTYAWMVWA